MVWGAWALWPWLSPAGGHWALWPCAACSSAGWATGAQPAADVLHSFLLACRLLLTRALGPWFLLAAGFWALWPRLWALWSFAACSSVADWALWPCLPSLYWAADWVLWPCLLSLGSGALDPLLTELGTGAQALFAPLAGPSLVTT